MKVAICGKGGSGKSSIAVLMARCFRDMGYEVLLIDADESNVALHRLLGLPSPVNVMDTLGGKKGFREKMAALNEVPQGKQRTVFEERWRIATLPEHYAMRADGITVLQVGKIHNFAEGCACPMGVLSKMVLSNLEVGPSEVVIVDTEAGLEHFGRGLESQSDVIVGVVDPTYESFLLAEKIEEMGRHAGKPVWFVLNKVNDEVEDIMAASVRGARVVGKVPWNDAIFRASFEGTALDLRIPEVERICELLLGTGGT